MVVREEERECSLIEGWSKSHSDPDDRKSPTRSREPASVLRSIISQSNESSPNLDQQVELLEESSIPNPKSRLIIRRINYTTVTRNDLYFRTKLLFPDLRLDSRVTTFTPFPQLLLPEVHEHA